MVDKFDVALPVWVRTAGKQLRDMVPTLPPLRRGRDHPGRGAARDCDLDLLSVLYLSHQFGCFLA